MSILVNGNFYTGKDARRHQTTARCEPDGTMHFDDYDIGAIHIKDIVVSDPIGNIPRTLRFVNGQSFESNDHKKLNRWLSSVQPRANWLHTFESNWRFVIGAAVALVVILYTGVRWGIPAASDVIATRLPVEVSAAIGAGALEALDDSFFEASALPDEQRARISKAFASTLPSNTQQPLDKPNPGVDYRLEFRSGQAIGANAFALPDGTIVVTDELITLAKNTDEVLSVLLHEMGHVERRHSLRMLISHSGLAMLSLAILGDVSSAGALVLALPSVLVESSYSRDLESEADDYALTRMIDLKIDPQHFANLMLRLERCAFLIDENFSIEQCEAQNNSPAANDQGTSLINYLSSHPTTAERITKFQTAN